MKCLIVPGVGGSEAQHWQSWLQQQLPDTQRVEQDQWDQPIIQVWVDRLIEILQTLQQPTQLVAHSFGCLTSVVALAQRPDLFSQISKLVLVAPANPERFSHRGLRQSSEASIANLLPAQALSVPSCLIASRTDPWLDFATAQCWAQRWQSHLIDLGDAGHINVAAGFGAWPDLMQYLHSNTLPVNGWANTAVTTVAATVLPFNNASNNLSNNASNSAAQHGSQRSNSTASRLFSSSF